MENIKKLPWPLILVLGVIALVRPLINIVGIADQVGRPLAPLLATLVISVIWVAAASIPRVGQPVLTLVFAGLTYGVLSIVLSAILSPILSGQLQGPLTTPFGFGVIAVLIVNAIWGAIAGVIALLVRQVHPRSRTERH